MSGDTIDAAPSHVSHARFSPCPTGVMLLLFALLLATAPLRWAGAGLAAIALGVLILIRPAVGLASGGPGDPTGQLHAITWFWHQRRGRRWWH